MRNAVDPTAAPEYDDVPAVDLVMGVDSAADDQEPQPWCPADGFVDGTSTVRIWVGPDGEPERIQLARYWRDQVARIPLSILFAEPLLQIALWSSPGLPDTEVEIDEPEIEEYAGPVLSRLLAEGRERLVRRLDELQTRGEGIGRWVGTPAVGTAAEGRVRFHLDLCGAPSSVSFDDRWLAEASATEVTTAVLTAWRQARRSHHPAVYEPGEWDLLVAQVRALGRRREKAFARGLDLSEIDDATPVSDKEQR